MDNTPPSAPSVTPEVRRAVHAVGGPFDSMLALCERAVDPAGPHHVACFRHGVLSFSVNVLAALGGHGNEVREQFERAGGQLDFAYSRLDQSLEALSSGRLRRMMLRFDQGAVVYDMVRAGEYVVSSVLGSEQALLDRADRRSAALAGRLGECLRGRGPSDAAAQRDPAASNGHPQPSAKQGKPTPKLRGDTQSHADEVSVCSNALEPGTLQMVARFRGRELLFSSDLLDLPALAGFFRRITVDRRRDRYADVAWLLHSMARQLERSQIVQLRGPLTQLVAEVEEGAVSYVHIEGDDFLVGVSLQPAPAATEANQALRHLAAHLRSSGADPERGDISRRPAP